MTQNCKECVYCAICKSWYGGTTCKIKDEIYRALENAKKD